MLQCESLDVTRYLRLASWPADGLALKYLMTYRLEI